MTAETCNVEARMRDSLTWTPYVDRVSHADAMLTAEVVQRIYPEWELRVIDTTTGDITHLPDEATA